MVEIFYRIKKEMFIFLSLKAISAGEFNLLTKELHHEIYHII